MVRCGAHTTPTHEFARHYLPLLGAIYSLRVYPAHGRMRDATVKLYHYRIPHPHYRARTGRHSV